MDELPGSGCRAAPAVDVQGLQAYVAKQKILLDLSQKLGVETDVEVAIRSIMDAIKYVLDVRGAELFARRPDGSLALVWRQFAGERVCDFDVLCADRPAVPCRTALGLRCAVSRSPVWFVKQQPLDLDLDPEGDVVALRDGVRASLVVPVLVRGRCEGTLHLHSKAESGFDLDSYSSALTLASLLSGTIATHRAEVERDRSERQLRRVIDAVSDGIALIDATDRVAVINDAYASHLGQHAERPMGEKASAIEFLAEESRGYVEPASFLELVARGRVADDDGGAELETVSGRRLSRRVTPIEGLGHLLMFTDVTAERLTQIALREAKDAAENANRAKSSFLANMSHEIRTPMTAILGFADILMESGLDESESRSHLETIRSNAEHLLALLNDILDLSKVEAQQFDIERIPVSLLQLIADVTGLVCVQAESKGLELVVERDPAVPDRVISDPTRLKQILVNLLTNAVKFTDTGAVTLQVSWDPSRRCLVFRVRDTGIGLTKAQRARLFKPFAQADVSTTRRFGGTGLGLCISRSLAELLGGSLEIASSEPGIGSVFELIVAAETVRDEEVQPEAPVQPEATASAGISGRILLAEDSRDNQRLLRHILERAGAEVVVVEDGQEAVECAAQGFDIILMDMQMPVMDGYTATRRLRESGYTDPIIALTANALAEDRERCFAAGCDDFAAKPVNRKDLFATIRRYLLE